jgi:hypothetical protein
MEEMKNYKQTFRTLSNAFYWANQSWFMDNLAKKIFENNLHLNPPRAARINAVVNVTSYDAFVACWDAKYTYWGIRPNQYDTTFRPAIMVTPLFLVILQVMLPFRVPWLKYILIFFRMKKIYSGKKQKMQPNQDFRPAYIFVQIMRWLLS